MPNSDEIRREELVALRRWLKSKISESEKSLAEARDHLDLVESQLTKSDDKDGGMRQKISQHLQRLIKAQG